MMTRLACTAALALTAFSAPAHAGSLMLGSYPDKMLVVDDTTGKVTQRIQLAEGLPVSLRKSNDEKKIFITTITTSGFIVLDAATKAIVTQFSLNTPTVRYR
jgi:hypothetical protein